MNALKHLVIQSAKGFVDGLGGFWPGNFGGNQDTVAERNTLIGSQCEVQCFLPIAEDFFSERVGGEQAISASVPRGMKAGIGGEGESRNRNRLVSGLPAHMAPAPASSPGPFA